MSYHAKVIKGGKIVIPVELRREYGFNDGDTIVLEREGDALVLKGYKQVLSEVQAKVRALITMPITVDDYIAEKRKEAASA